MSWKLKEWNGLYGDDKMAPMTSKEIYMAIKHLRDSNYPKPVDCPETDCPDYRPACILGICRIAVGMCGDF